MLTVFYIVQIFFLTVYVGQTQDLSIYGLFTVYNTPTDPRNLNNIYASCFEGIGYETCVPNLPSDDLALDPLLPYYRDLGSYVGQAYCLACCGTPANYIDTWDLSCTVDEFTSTKGNLYGFELRLARNRYLNDLGYVRCPLRRTACQYSSSGETLSCNRANDTTYLVGYTATIRVVQYNVMFKYWRGASSCSIESEESTTPLQAGDSFREIIVLDHVAATYPSFDSSKLFFLVLCFVFVAYGFLYCCRRKRCVYCQQKLVLSLHLCIKCRLVGAEPPDPVLLQMMEEKGKHLQGEIPERFPGARYCTESIRAIIARCLCRTTAAKISPSLYAETVSSKNNVLEEGKGDEESFIADSFPSPGSEKSASKKKKKWFKKNENPNLLKYDVHVIGGALQHRDYLADKTVKEKGKREKDKNSKVV